MKTILILGTLLGLTGALLVALKKYFSGQAVWLVSNALLLVFYSVERNFWMVLLFGTYEALTVFALWNLVRQK